MRRIVLFFSILVLCQASSIFAQTLEDYVLEHRGDTLVVKDDFDMAQNTLYNILLADSINVPAGRVYMLKAGGTYSVINTPNSAKDRKVYIVGQDRRSVKTNKAVLAPPVVCGAVYDGGTSTGGLNTGYDLEIKNIAMNCGNSAMGEGWAFLSSSGANCKITVDNCIFEHNLWVVLFLNNANSRVYFKNSYFVNLSGQPCRRNGGMIDMFSNQDTIFVENCTHVATQGYMYKTRTYSVNQFLVNHNTFVNCAGYQFMNCGTLANFSVTNNIFINCNVQGFTGNINVDPGECDPDGLPMGFINARSADSLFVAKGAHIYVDKNLIYWDAALSDYIATLNTNKVNGISNWLDCMITMNTRTQALFNDNAKWPYLYEGTWIKNKKPTFKETNTLFTTQLADLKAFCLAAVDTNGKVTMPDWRQPSNPSTDYYIYSDWPIPVDLSYTDADLLTAGLNNFPLGDLNWFPTQQVAWEAQRSHEIAQINQTLATGIPPTAVENETNVAKKFELVQNYPNPFNPSTDISFTLPHAGNVVLKVYNTLGQEVATLVNGMKQAQTYHVNFNASNLPSGVYIYSINFDNASVSKKMILMK